MAWVSKKRLLGLKIAVVLIMVATQASAQLVQNIFIGNPKALALGNAVTADPPGTDAIHFNPAGLARLKGRQFELKGILANLSLEADFTPGSQLQSVFDDFGDLGLVDPGVAYQTSEVDGVSVMLPFNGLTKLPVLAAGLGNFTIANEERRLTFGTGVYAPIMLGLNRDANDPGVYSSSEVGITRLTYFSPTMGIQLTDTLSVGAGIGFSYFGVGLNFDMRLPNFVLGSFDSLQQANCLNGITNLVENIICGDGNNDGIVDGRLNPFASVASIEAELEKYVSATFNLGLLWEATPWLTLGMAYMSGSRDQLDGEVRIRYSDDVRGFVNSLSGNPYIGSLVQLVGVPGELSSDTTDASVIIEYPQHLAFGASVHVTEKFKTNLDVKWTDTAVWDIWEIKFEQPVEFLGILGLIADSLDQGTTGGHIGSDGLYLPRGYQSVWSWALGMEYQYNDRLALRAGYEPRGNSIPRDKADVIVPIGDTFLYSVGFGYQWNQDTWIDGALGYVTSKQKIPANSSTNSTSTAIDNFIYNPYAGYDIETRVDVVVGEISIRSTF